MGPELVSERRRVDFREPLVVRNSGHPFAQHGNPSSGNFTRIGRIVFTLMVA